MFAEIFSLYKLYLTCGKGERAQPVPPIIFDCPKRGEPRGRI